MNAVSPRKQPGWHALPVAVALAALLLCVSCGGSTGAEIRLAEDLAWPVGDPRIRLVEVVEFDSPRSERGSRLLGKPGWAPEGQTGFRRPYGVAWDGDELLVTDPGLGIVIRVAADGSTRSSPDRSLARPIAIASCAAGTVVTDTELGKVALLDPELRVARWLADGLSRPSGVACVGGRIFVAETGMHRVVELLSDGEIRPLGGRGEGPGEFNFPTAISMDGDDLLVGDTLNFRLQRIDTAGGGFRDTFGQLGDAPGEMPRLKGLAVDARGNIWVSDGHLNRVSLYDRQGNLLLTVGGRGSEDGRFDFPAGIAAHADGRVAVVDSFNRRVQIFRLIGSSNASDREDGDG